MQTVDPLLRDVVASLRKRHAFSSGSVCQSEAKREKRPSLDEFQDPPSVRITTSNLGEHFPFINTNMLDPEKQDEMTCEEFEEMPAAHSEFEILLESELLPILTTVSR